MHVGLKQLRRAFEVFGQQLRLIVIMRPLRMPGDFLQADDIGILRLDDVDHACKPTTPIAAADAFVDVVAQKTHINFMPSVNGPGQTTLNSPIDCYLHHSLSHLATAGQWRMRIARKEYDEVAWRQGKPKLRLIVKIANVFCLIEFARLAHAAVGRQPNSSLAVGFPGITYCTSMYLRCASSRAASCPLPSTFSTISSSASPITSCRPGLISSNGVLRKRSKAASKPGCNREYCCGLFQSSQNHMLLIALAKNVSLRPLVFDSELTTGRANCQSVRIPRDGREWMKG